jgi:hypothetical protein
MFDADAYRAALELPTVKMDGRVYTGRLLSHQEWMRYQPTFERWRAGQASEAEMQVAMYGVLRAAFPRNPVLWWKPDPVKKILALDPRTLEAWLEDFFKSLAGRKKVAPLSE